MVPFHLEFEFADGQVAGTAEQLDQLVDTAGFMRYQVSADVRRSVICVNIEGEPKPALTAQDAENHDESTNYAEHGSGFSQDDVFTAEEVGVIATAIRSYHHSRVLNFDQLNFDF